MNTELDQRESNLMAFVNAKNREDSLEKSRLELEDSPELKMRKLSNEAKNGTSVCIDTVLGKIYKNALPFDDPKKNCSDDDARNEIRDFVAKRTNGQNSEYYIREALKKCNSTTLKNILTESEKISKKFYSEKAKDLGSIKLSDLDFNPNAYAEDIDKISKNCSADEISEIIQNNVVGTINAESDKAKAEEEYKNNLENMLTNDTTVNDDASMEAAIDRLNVIKQPTVYQPSLFEAIMLGSVKNYQESTGEDAFHEAVHEFTKLNIAKALKLERFNLDSIKKLANSYIA